MERGRPIAISRVEQGSEDAPGWIEGKELIRKAVHAVSQRATAESVSIRVRPVHRYFCVFMKSRTMAAMLLIGAIRKARLVSNRTGSEVATKVRANRRRMGSLGDHPK